jgi:hypothetical protein
MIFLHQASADHPSLVRPHWRNAVAAPVNRFTGGTLAFRSKRAVPGSPATEFNSIPFHVSHCLNDTAAHRIQLAIRERAMIFGQFACAH